jgi:hypothetical protein
LYQGIAVGDVTGDGKLDLATRAATGGAEVFIQEAGGKWRKASNGIVDMNVVFSVSLGDMNNDGKADLVAAGKTALDEIGGVYGVFVFLGDGQGNWTLVEGSGLPAIGREKSWGVGIIDIDNDGVKDIGVAFGDVLAPTWRSGAAKAAAAAKGKDEKKADKKDDKAARKAPERGQFGSIEVWRGELPSK